MNTISASVGVNFHPKLQGTNDYITFINGSGNYSSIGRIGGRQYLSKVIDNITIDSYIKGVIMHELCHALGLFHEQSRADRDSYVEILWNNIEVGKAHNFQTYIQRGYPGADIAEFNVNSILMYSSTSFGVIENSNKKTTIRLKNGQDYYTQRSYLADTDIATLRAIYGPPYAKVVKEREIDQNGSWDYNMGADFREEVNINTYVKFYQDEECTIPATLTTPRYLNVYSLTRYSYDSTPAHRQNYTITVPAGVQSYLIGSGKFLIHEEYGNVTEFYHSEYYVINSHEQQTITIF